MIFLSYFHILLCILPYLLGGLVLKRVIFVIFFLGVSIYTYSVADWVGDSTGCRSNIFYFIFLEILSSPRGVKKTRQCPSFLQNLSIMLWHPPLLKKFGFIGYFLNQFLCIVITRFQFKLPTLRSFMNALNTLRQFVTWHVTIFSMTSLHCHLLLALCRLLTCSWKYILLNVFVF